jgi:hypothetical protein
MCQVPTPPRERWVLMSSTCSGMSGTGSAGTLLRGCLHAEARRSSSVSS